MKRVFLIVVLSSFIGLSAFAQSDFRDRMFVSFHSSLYMDIIKSNLTYQNTQIGTNPNPSDPSGPGIPAYAQTPSQTMAWNIVSFGFEPRYNILELNDDAAIGISMPISFGIGNSYPSSTSVGGVQGFGSIQVPILAKIYVGTGSTYDSEKDFGFSLGGGFEYNKLGLINLETDPNVPKSKGWIMPAVSLGIHYWRGISPVELNLKFGLGQTEKYTIDKNGDAIEDQNGNLSYGLAKASSFRIGMGYILNY